MKKKLARDRAVLDDCLYSKLAEAFLPVFLRIVTGACPGGVSAFELQAQAAPHVAPETPPAGSAPSPFLRSAT